MRSMWILATYVTRPMVWLITAAMIGGGIFLYKVTTDQYETVGAAVIRGMSPIRTKGHLAAAIKQQEKQPSAEFEIDWSGLANEQLDSILLPDIDGSRHIGVAEHEVVNQRLNELTLPDNVVAIHIRGWGVGQEVVDRLGKITSLRRLGFLVGYGRQPLDLAPLSNLKELQVLDVGITGEPGSLQPLASLPKLHTLSLGSHQWVTQERLAEVAQLPALKTLFLPDVSSNQRAMNALQQLNTSATLREIRISIPMDRPKDLAAVKAKASQIPVSASRVYPSRLYALIYAVWACLIFSSLGLHVIGQFSLPMAQLAPRYQTAHQRVFWVIMATFAVGLTAVVCLYGANPLAVGSIIGLCLVSGSGDSILSLAEFGESRGVRRLLAFIGTVVFLGLIAMAFVRPDAAERYLMGDFFLLSTIFVVIAALIVVRVSMVMKQFYRTGVESGRPVMLSFHDVQRASIELRTRKLTAKADDAESVCQPYAQQGKLAVIFGYVALAVVVGVNFVSEPLYGVGVQQYVVMLLVFLTFWSLFIVGVKWWQRMPYLAGMLTRPPGRQQQIGELLSGVGVDVATLWPVGVANIVMISSSPLFTSYSAVAGIVVSTFFVAGIAVDCYATILWALTIRRVWGIVLLSFAVYTGISVLIAAAVTIGMTATQASDYVLPIGRLVVTNVLIAGIGIAATIWARRYYSRMEWGQFL